MNVPGARNMFVSWTPALAPGVSLNVTLILYVAYLVFRSSTKL
jgi:hypothetical protein